MATGNHQAGEPQCIKIQIPEKAERILTTKARLVVLIGGRGSAKTETIGRILLMYAERGADVFCCREIQESIKESSHKLLTELIHKLEIKGANIRQQKIDFASGGGFRYKGLAHKSSAIRSASGFKYAWVDEAQDLSEASIQDLVPTIRGEDSKIIFSGNPQASNDPFSQRFITPFKAHLDRYGFYEDDMHLIIVMNYSDNPWHKGSDLEKQRLSDYKIFSRAKYDHVWGGEFNDEVEDSIIKKEWFDAAVDAHKKLGFEPIGVRVVAHDPADGGPDAQGLCLRHGSVILDVQEKHNQEVNEGCDWATGYAIENDADLFIWDGIGMGAPLRRDIAYAFDGKKIDYEEFIASNGADDPDCIYEPIAGEDRGKGRTNKETFKNKRAQYCWMLRTRFYNAYLAVEKGKYIDRDTIISISGDIACLAQLRSETCRIPSKYNPNGFKQIMSKDEMKRKHGIKSPNLFDSMFMSLMSPAAKQADVEMMPVPMLRRLGAPR